MSLGQQHLTARVRLFKYLEPFPSKDAFRRGLDYLMFGVGIIAPFALLPQVIELYSSKSSVGLSLTTWILLSFYNLLWVLYGAVHRTWPVLLANTLMAVFDLIIVVGILLY